MLTEAPYTHRVGAAAEQPTDVSDLGKSPVLGKYVPNLIHRGPPTEPAIQMIEYLDGVGGVVLLEVDPYFLTEASRLRHQATAVWIA